MRQRWHQIFTACFSSSYRNSRQSQAAEPATSWTLGIDSLPSDLLILIFRLLPRCDRIRVERVCRHWRQLLLSKGWSHERSYGDSIVYGSISHLKYSKLSKAYKGLAHGMLKRCGPHITTLDLGNSGKKLHFAALLKICRNVRHISLSSNLWINPENISHLQHHACAAQLKSLSWTWSWHWDSRGCKSAGHMGEEMEYKATCDAFAVALPYFSQLECLRIHSEWFYDFRWLELISSRSLIPNLRVLLLHQPGYKTTLNQEQGLPQLTGHSHLRSLQLYCDYLELGCLGQLVHLEHLELMLKPSNAKSFIDDAFPHMRKLSSLEVLCIAPSNNGYPNHSEGYFSAVDMFSKIASCLLLYHNTYQLEHLALRSWWSPYKSGPKMQLLYALQWLQLLPQLKRLRSLELEFWLPPLGDFPWSDFLVEIAELGRLEHLLLRREPSLEALRCLARKCKKLRYIELRTSGKCLCSHPGICRELISGAAAVDAEERRDFSSSGSLPLLYVNLPYSSCVPLAHFLRTEGKDWRDGEEEESLIRVCVPKSRVRFTKPPITSSHVMIQHKFGSLSESNPAMYSNFN